MTDVSNVVVGKVTAIMPFGAFVQLNDGSSGLVHISEISEEFVRDVGAILHTGQSVRVLCLGEEHDGKKRLSIKRANALLKAAGQIDDMTDVTEADTRRERAPRDGQSGQRERNGRDRGDGAGREGNRRSKMPPQKFSMNVPPPMYDELRPAESTQFEDKLAKFMKDSGERLVDLKHQTDHKRGGGYVRRG